MKEAEQKALLAICNALRAGPTQELTDAMLRLEAQIDLDQRRRAAIELAMKHGRLGDAQCDEGERLGDSL